MPLPLILLPGLLCDEASLADVARIVGAGRRVIVADYGARNSIAAMAESVLAAAPPRFALAGHSMGGRVALETLRTAPDRIAGLALLDTATPARPAGEAGERERRERLALLAIAEREGMRVMGRRWSEPMVHPGRLGDAALMNAILDMIARKSPAVFAAQIAALLGRPDAGPLLAAIRCPALVLCGREDGWSPLARHEAIAAAISGSRLAVIERCGHMAPMERPEAVAAAFAPWLAAIDAAEDRGAPRMAASR